MSPWDNTPASASESVLPGTHAMQTSLDVTEIGIHAEHTIHAKHMTPCNLSFADICPICVALHGLSVFGLRLSVTSVSSLLSFAELHQRWKSCKSWPGLQSRLMEAGGAEGSQALRYRHTLPSVMLGSQAGRVAQTDEAPSMLHSRSGSACKGLPFVSVPLLRQKGCG